MQRIAALGDVQQAVMHGPTKTGAVPMGALAVLPPRAGARALQAVAQAAGNRHRRNQHRQRQ